MKAAGSTFGLEIYDAVAGLAIQPLRGVRQDGFTGLLKGVGKGFGGLILKPAAGILAVPAYALKGIHVELEQNVRPTFSGYIRGIRVAQGEREWAQATAEEVAVVISHWKSLDSPGKL